MQLIHVQRILNKANLNPLSFNFDSKCSAKKIKQFSSLALEFGWSTAPLRQTNPSRKTEPNINHHLIALFSSVSSLLPCSYTTGALKLLILSQPYPCGLLSFHPIDRTLPSLQTNSPGPLNLPFWNSPLYLPETDKNSPYPFRLPSTNCPLMQSLFLQKNLPAPVTWNLFFASSQVNSPSQLVPSQQRIRPLKTPCPCALCTKMLYSLALRSNLTFLGLPYSHMPVRTSCGQSCLRTPFPWNWFSLNMPSQVIPLRRRLSRPLPSMFSFEMPPQQKKTEGLYRKPSCLLTLSGCSCVI